jgi:hypothetical protein
MSLADEVRTVRERVATRLAELEPLVQEYEELRALADELGLAARGPAAPVAVPEPVAVPGPVAAPQALPPPGSPGVRPRGRAGQRQESDRRRHVLDAVRSNPGVTVAEVASILDTPAKSLYRPVRELTSSGELVKRGRQLFAATA